ncbi:hypothetical protein Q4508_14080 [Amphritea sp. 2_MG-2023]|uniref:hypothetical protein n=1 Tax=Amphritea TaxID=515417 RepID=UPI001C0759DA|nr:MULTISPECIES: hypothetical protein [Amphritea]MBU2964357.1 hypothetical protein [Amphritea atlantica]MDO6419683.1 hypothetical protein [Amphritea sp. 2_MG-2023]
MRQLLIGVVAGMLLPLYPAQANIQTDLETGLPLTEVIQHAIAEAVSVENIMAQLLIDCKPIPADDSEEETIGCGFGTAESIVSAAASSFSEDPDALKLIGQAGIDKGLTEDQLIAIALNNGLDPTALLPATAAGPAAGPETAGAGTLLPTTLGTATGGGGGGSASPSS